VRRGRAVPLIWASYPEWVLAKSQNNLEEGLVRLLRSLVPPGVRIILLADRGFGRARLAKTCRGVRGACVLRLPAALPAGHPRDGGLWSDVRVGRGGWRTLKGAEYRGAGVVRLTLGVRGKKGLPAKRDEPWFLMTDLDRTAVAVSDLYAKRMTVEELFRD